MDFNEFYEKYKNEPQTDINKLLENESIQNYQLINRYYNCTESVVATEKGIALSEPLRWLLVNMGVDPLNIELDEEMGFALLYHTGGRIFRVKAIKGTNERPFSMYKDFFINFNEIVEIYST